MNNIDYSLERRAQWGQYKRHLELSADHLNKAQEFHRQLFGEENSNLLAATLGLSIENEKAGSPT